MDASTYIANLPEIDSSTLAPHDQTCRICLVDFQGTPGVRNEDATSTTDLDNTAEKPVRLICGHLFGRVCISAWLVGGNNTCPTCRGTVVANSAPPSYTNLSAIANNLLAEQLYGLMAIAHGTAAGAILEELDEHFSDDIRQIFVDALAHGTDTPEADYHRAEFFAVYDRYHHRFGLTPDGVSTFWTLAISDEISDEWWIFVREGLLELYSLVARFD